MINDEELDIIVEGYCKMIRKICDETVYLMETDKVLEKVAKISKFAARAQELKSIQEAQKTEGEEE